MLCSLVYTLRQKHIPLKKRTLSVSFMDFTILYGSKVHRGTSRQCSHQVSQQHSNEWELLHWGKAWCRKVGFSWALKESFKSWQSVPLKTVVVQWENQMEKRPQNVWGIQYVGQILSSEDHNFVLRMWTAIMTGWFEKGGKSAQKLQSAEIFK